MAARATNDSFMSTTEARHVRPGWIMGGVADSFSSDWYVEYVATRVKDKHIIVGMRLDGTGRLVESITAPDEIVFRTIHKNRMG